MTENTVTDTKEEEAITNNRQNFYRSYGKRFLDILLSGTALIVLSPLLIVLAILVRIIHGSPVFFTPTRAGKNEKIFPLYKFRSMSNARDKEGVLLPESQRMTKFGKMLRASSMDELPQLFNILKGDMSIIGPRPLPKFYLPVYTEFQRERHLVRPGLTGLAQISGRNNAPWEKRFEADVRYVRELSLGFDISIVFNTVLKVISGADIIDPSHLKVLPFVTHRKLEEENLNTVVYGGSEIGSDFFRLKPVSAPDEKAEASDAINWLPKAEDGALTVSGRAAIEIALNDILLNKAVNKVFVPSYCSYSMLQAFINKNIDYEFYDIGWDGKSFSYNLDRAGNNDICLVMSYFGLDRDILDAFIERLHSKGCIVIEDITHSLLSQKNHCEKSDYLAASLRKWFAVPAGGWVGKNFGKLSLKPNLKSGESISKCKQAMQEKYEYVSGLSNIKTDFLVKFAEFETSLVQMNCLMTLDKETIDVLSTLDIESIANQRKRNAGILFESLSGISGLACLLNHEVINSSAPLYFPVLLNHKERNSLYEFLKKNGVFCQVTWPETVGASLGIRDRELSLVCDQRYSTGDMKRVLELITVFFKH